MFKFWLIEFCNGEEWKILIDFCWDVVVVIVIWDFLKIVLEGEYIFSFCFCCYVVFWFCLMIVKENIDVSFVIFVDIVIICK